MLRATPALLLACAPLGCSDPPEPVVYLEHCGATGPTRVLPLAPGQTLGTSYTIGERTYHTIGRRERGETTWFPALKDRSTWSTGPCGESPVHIGDDIPLLFNVSAWPEVALVCREGSGVVALDPLGAAPPNLLFATPECAVLGWNDLGLFTFAADESDGHLGELWFYPYPDDPSGPPVAPIVLAQRILGHSTQIAADAVHVLTEAATLARIDLPDGETTPLQTNVFAYAFSNDRRYLVWQDASAPLVSLRDDTTGTSVALGTTQFLWGDLDVSNLDAGILVFGEQIFFLPALTVLDLPRYSRVRHLDPARGFALLERYSGLPWLSRIELADGTLTPLYRNYAELYGPADDAVQILGVLPCCEVGHYGDEGEVWSVPLDGGPARRLADRATRIHWRPDATSLVTLVDIDPRNVGTLVRIDTDTRAEQVLAADVSAAASLQAGPDPGVITYSVDDGERSGVYTARIAATP